MSETSETSETIPAWHDDDDQAAFVAALAEADVVDLCAIAEEAAAILREAEAARLLLGYSAIKLRSVAEAALIPGVTIPGLDLDSIAEVVSLAEDLAVVRLAPSGPTAAAIKSAKSSGGGGGGGGAVVPPSGGAVLVSGAFTKSRRVEADSAKSWNSARHSILAKFDEAERDRIKAILDAWMASPGNPVATDGVTVTFVPDAA